MISLFLVVILNINLIHCRQYIYIDQPKNWQDAQAYCRGIGSDLATILTPNELSNAITITESNNANVVWIGLHDSQSNDNYIWSNGEPCDTSTNTCTTFWSTDVFGGHCVILHTEGIFTRRRLAITSQGFVAIDCISRELSFLCNPIPIPKTTATKQTSTPLKTSLTSTTNIQPATSHVQNTITTQLITSTEPHLTTTSIATTAIKTTSMPSVSPTATTVMPSSTPTKSPTVHNYAMNNDYIYVFEPQLNFQQAQQFCRNKYGTNLGSIINENDIESIVSLITNDMKPQGNRLWIGLCSTSETGWWKWIDNSQCIEPSHGACMSSLFWVDGEPKCIPDKKGYNCTVLGIVNKKLDNNIKCDKIGTFVCNNVNRNSVNAITGIHLFDNNNGKQSGNKLYGSNGIDMYGIFVLIGIGVMIISTCIIICWKKYSNKSVLYTLSKQDWDQSDESDVTEDELDEILASSNSI